ncbi:MAG TPA: glutamate mutase L [Anaerolineaceae bacterium]|nr:glutamate mutase L [Anaerolineaceae bacterium]
MQNYIGLEITAAEIRAWLFDDRAGSFELRGYTSEDFSAVEDLTGAVQRAISQILPGETGVTAYGLSISAGRPIRTVLIGASSLYSLEAAHALAAPFYTQIIDELDLQDGLNVVEQLERLLRTDADLFIVTGGFEEGSTKPVLAALDNLGVMLKAHNRSVPPQIVYVGNSLLTAEIQNKFGREPNFHLGGNISPAPGQTDLGAGMEAILAAFRRIRRAEFIDLPSVEENLRTQCIPSLLAQRRMLSFLGRISSTQKPVLLLSVEPGLVSALTSQAAGQVIVLPQRWDYAATDEDEPWLFNSQLLEKDANLVYLMNKQAHKNFVPVTVEDQLIEQSWFRIALRKCCKVWREQGYFIDSFIPEPVILTGSSLAVFGKDPQLLLAILDGLELHGITTYVLDENSLITGLGALAPVNALLAAEVLDSGLFRNLGTVVTVTSPLKAGKSVLDVEVRHKFGAQFETFSILKSELRHLDVEANAEQKIHLLPKEESDLGLGGTGVGGTLNHVNLKTGLIIDARGRPLEMPKDTRTRAAVVANWLSELGG